MALRGARDRAGERGQALIEAMFVIPFVLALILLILDFGIALDRREVMVHAVREGARAIFVIGAIVVDIGLWVSERRNAQAAADLAALAAATQLRDPSDPNAAAIAKGLDFAKRNGYDTADSRIRVDVFPDLGNDTV